MGLPAEIIARLSSQGVGSSAATSTGWLLVAREFVPSTAHAQQIAIVETGGARQDRLEVDRRAFQVLIRASATSSTGLGAKVDAVDAALNAYGGTLSGRKYVDIERQGDRLYLGRDENQRPMYSLNYLAFRSQTT